MSRLTPIICALALLLAATPAVTAATPPIQYGVLGNDSSKDADEYARGIRVKLVEVWWRSAEPTPGVFDAGYFSWLRKKADALKAKGFKVVLGTGIHHAPSWLMAWANTRYVNQYGDVYRGDADLPNLVFNRALRIYAARYLERVFRAMGTSWFAIRAGGGPMGELQYPDDKYNGKRNQYWAFDGAAARSNPVPGWKPGMASANHWKAKSFLNWYYASLVDYQNWQIAQVRRWTSSPIAVLYPGWGVRYNQFADAVAHDLNGSTSPEQNGEIQEGKAFGRQINAITATNMVAWSTYGERRGDETSGDTRRWGPVHFLSVIAGARGFRTMAENSGRDSVTVMDAALQNARQYKVAAFLWAREEELYCRCNGWATIEQYDARIP
jgi:hypothetical protein